MAAKSDAGKYKDLVYNLLERYSGLRDSTQQLYLACIMNIRGNDYIRNKTLYDFFVTEFNDPSLPKVPSLASVIRLSTKLQKEFPHLRGKDWEKRQAHSKDYVEDLYGK